MLPLHLEVMRPNLLPYAKFAMLTSGSKFGVQDTDDHVLERLNNFVKRIEDPSLMEDYTKLFINGNRHPDLFQEDKSYSTHMMNFAFSDTPELLESRRHLDVPTGLHLASGGSFERYLTKLMTRLDDESIISSNIEHGT